MRDFTVPKGSASSSAMAVWVLSSKNALRMTISWSADRPSISSFIRVYVCPADTDLSASSSSGAKTVSQSSASIAGRPAAAQQVDPLVARDGVDPGRGRSAAAVEARGLAPHHDQRFLRHFLRGLGVGAALHDEGLHPRRVVAEQAGEGRPILTRRDGLDQVGGFVGSQAGRPCAPRSQNRPVISRRPSRATGASRCSFGACCEQAA